MAIDRWAMLSRWQRWIGEIRSLNKGDRVVSRVTVYLREMNPLKITFCITSSFLSMLAVSSCPLFTQTHCRDVLVYIIDLWCWGLVILASTVWMSISIHLHWHPTNGEGIQFASIHSKTILFYGLADIYHQAKPMWWNPQTACRLTVNVPPLLQEQINPQQLWWKCRQLTINMYGFRKLYCMVTIF